MRVTNMNNVNLSILLLLKLEKVFEKIIKVMRILNDVVTGNLQAICLVRKVNALRVRDIYAAHNNKQSMDG